MALRRKTYGPIILRLLLGDPLEHCDRGDIGSHELLYVAAQNRVLIRTVDKLRTIGVQPSQFLYSLANEMRACNRTKLALIERIAQRCADRKIAFMFPNAVQNYPDMGSDIDLYVATSSTDVDAEIVKSLNATPVRRHLRNRVDGTATYKVAGCDSLLDIHHGSVGLLGEHKLIGQIIGNGRSVTVDGREFLVPSPEDQLILQAAKVMQRSYLPLSDLLTTVRLLRETPLEWNYILKTIRSLCISFELGCYLGFVDQIHREAFNEPLVPELKGIVSSKKAASIEFKNGFYRFPRVRTSLKGYGNRFWSAVRSENWKAASRLSLLPLIALPGLVRKLRISS
ncbi:MAG: nucleotidyltransferase family protein [Acidobacteriota bacterium]